jgi:repressor LexA
LDKHPLTNRQQEILEYVAAFTRDTGYPPTVREIGRATGLRSPRSVSQHLHALEKKGFIHRGREKSRAIRVLDRPDSPVQPAGGHAIPLMMRGRVVAGQAVAAGDVPGSSYFVDRTLFSGTGNFLMRVEGDCMVDEHILSGDLIVVSPDPTVRHGDVVVARVNGEVSVKRYEASGNSHRLVSDAGPIALDASVQIVGKVVGLIRPHC